MSATRLMVILFGIIVIGGAVIGIVASGFNYEVEEERWTKPIEAVSGFIIDIVKYVTQIFTFIFDLVAGIFQEGIFFFTTSETSGDVITISGTGTHNGDTLDGNYIDVGDTGNESIREFWYNETDGFLGRDIIRVELSDTGSVQKAELQSNDFSFFVNTIYNSTSVGNANEEWYENWELVETGLNLNQNAQGTASQLDNNQTIGGATQKVQNFFGEVKNETQTSISYVSVVPEIIGYPIMIFFFFAMVVGIIKMAPWT